MGERREELSRDDLVTAIDMLWGFMPTTWVNEIKANETWLYDICKQVHHDLWHGTTHEQRMMRRPQMKEAGTMPDPETEQHPTCPVCGGDVESIETEVVESPIVDDEGMLTEAGTAPFRQFAPGRKTVRPCGHVFEDVP